jgi:hypothetical protein
MQSLDQALHRRLCASAARDKIEMYRDAARVAPELVPAYLDWVGFIGLSASGEFLFIPWDPPHMPESVHEAYLVRAAVRPDRA